MRAGHGCCSRETIATASLVPESTGAWAVVATVVVMAAATAAAASEGSLAGRYRLACLEDPSCLLCWAPMQPGQLSVSFHVFRCWGVFRRAGGCTVSFVPFALRSNPSPCRPGVLASAPTTMSCKQNGCRCGARGGMIVMSRFFFSLVSAVATNAVTSLSQVFGWEE